MIVIFENEHNFIKKILYFRTPRDPFAKKTKKKRRGKLPKDYVEGETPDPERWLPKYERTGFRKKRDRRAKDIIKGSQGSATNASEA